MNESLFSLELHVESVDRVKVSCVIPAVSFRLLDYPTLIIHLVAPSSAKKLLEKTRIQGIPKEHVEAELRDRYGNIPFRKGKSCLFKANISSLQQQLGTTPLYVILLDLWNRKPKLVGSTVISLSDAVDKLFADVKKFGISVPSVCEDEGTFDIFNLMGSVIGRIKLSFRLLSLGGSLIPHIPAKSIMAGQEEKKTLERDIKTNENKVIFELEDVDVEHRNDLCLNKKCSELDSGPKQQNIETQTEQSMPTVLHRTLQVKKPNHTEETDVFPITNTVCPPPLYYNFMSQTENVGNKKAESHKQKKIHNSNTNYGIGVDDVDFIYYRPSLLQPDGSIGCASVCVQTEDVETDRSDMTNKDIEGINTGAIEKRLDSEGLPLLDALLEELNYLRTKRQYSHPLDTKTDKAKNENVTPEKVKQPSKPRECCLKVAVQKSALLKSTKPKQRVVPKKKVKFKQTSLRYGTTRTQLMRLEMNQKDRTKNVRCHDTDSDDKTLPLHTYSGQRQDIVKNRIPEDLGKTHTIFASPVEREEIATTSVAIQTDGELPTIPENQTQSDTKSNGPATQELGKTVILNKLQKEEHADVDNNSTSSLARQNSLDIYLPQVEGDSDESSGKEVSSDDVSLPELPTTTTKYGHTGIHSPDLPEPIRKQSITSPPVRSRTSTALSMYSDDFEESQIWEAQSQSDNDESDTSSTSHVSVNSCIEDKGVSSQVAYTNDVKVDHAHPITSDFSPQKTKKLTKIKGNVYDDSGSVNTSFQEDSKSYDGRTALDTPDVNRESLFDSLNSTKSDYQYTTKRDHIISGTLTREEDIDNLSVSQLPKPATDLGYTY